jgi:2-oxoglutarate ferredoxin oxidoreductase subunit alpha
VRASEKKIQANRGLVDLLVALDIKSVEKHAHEIVKGGLLVYDSSDKKMEKAVEDLDVEPNGLPFSQIVKELNGKPIMRNSAAIGAISKIIGIDFEVVERVFRKFVPKETGLNIKIAKRSYELPTTSMRVERLNQEVLPVLLGNEAIALGAIMAGLDVYYAYPMTPSTSILHYLAKIGKKLGILVVQPENEIAVMLMALGSAYAGKKTMVASSGGGFALMVEGLSLSGQAEIPMTIVVSQRAGPSTGVPTYTMQADLHFVLNAGHGEFPRFVVAPGDAEEAYYYTALAMNMAWKYQIPSFVLSDKHLSESLFSFEPKEVEEEEPLLWDGEGEYKRYRITENGVSPLAFPGETIVKSNSYTHDEYGITTEEAEKVEMMQEKRQIKRKQLEEEVKKMEAVKVYGEANEAIITWGSTKGVCVEAAEELGLMVIQPVVLEPFPDFKKYENLEKKIVVEVNSTGQLMRLLKNNGVEVDETILKYNARPFFLEELVERLKEVL